MEADRKQNVVNYLKDTTDDEKHAEKEEIFFWFKAMLMHQYFVLDL